MNVRIYIFTLDKIEDRKNVVVILKQKIRNLEFNHEIFSFGQLLQVVSISSKYCDFWYLLWTKILLFS